MQDREQMSEEMKKLKEEVEILKRACREAAGAIHVGRESHQAKGILQNALSRVR